MSVVFCVLSQAQGHPGTTHVSDTVYRADGTPAGGVLLISWGPFTTANSSAVAAGNLSVTLGAGGALAVDLVPNAGATPASSYYTVVYQLNDNSVRTEFWLVPTTSPATLAAVRAVPGTGTTASLASKQYVDSEVAGKAADNAVVHLAGGETIAGAKQFAVPPSVPAPVGAQDVANKGYVDAAVQSVGAGNFVAKAGDSMTGPLNLPGDPVSANSASTKHYVDINAAGKASLVGGVVPPAQLGSGSADGTVCLKGNSTWGACGTSSNAVSIQGVPVDTTAPTDGQVVTYVASSGKYTPKPGGSGNATSLQGVPMDTTAPSDGQVMTYVASTGKYTPKAGNGLTSAMQTVKYATDLVWTASPAADLSTAGPKTVSLASCPLGVSGAEKYYYVYIASTGTPEAVLVTGGTCVGNGAAGTLQFTTVNAHPPGYTIASASGGIQEASIVARQVQIGSNNATYMQGGRVHVTGQVQLYAPVTLLTTAQTIDFSGSSVVCNFNADCLVVGDASNYNGTTNVTLVNPRGEATVVHGTHAFIAVYGQKTRILNLMTLMGKYDNVTHLNGVFGTYVSVVADQAFLLDGLDTTAGWGLEGGPAVLAPGPFSGPDNAAVGWLKHMQLSPQCSGNGVDWQSGNSLRISDSVIQGYDQFGVRGGLGLGGYGMIELDNVYMEDSGACPNPLGNVGTAGVIAQGGKISIRDGEAPSGHFPQFANTGSTRYDYYIVAKNASYGASNPLYAGYALTNGSGNITVTTADLPYATSYDLLRVTASGWPSGAPNGAGNYGVAIGVSHTTCSGGVCSFTDNAATTPASYTVAAPTYFPYITYWPGPLVLGSLGDGNSILSPATAYLELNTDSMPYQVNELGTVAPAISANRCVSEYGGSPLWMSCLTAAYPPTSQYEQNATILAVKPNADGGLRTNMKGRLNFSSLGTAPSHIITLSDSNFAKTVSSLNGRAQNDANDAYIGYDYGDGAPAHVGISLGAPISISEYIGNVGDGTSFLERLTAGSKVFNVPVTVNGNLTVTGTCTGCGGGGGQGVPTGGSAGQVLAKIDATNYNTQWINPPTGEADAFTPASGTKTINGNLSVSGSISSTGPGAWSVTGAYGTLTAAPAGKSLLGFDATGALAVSANGGTVTEVAMDPAVLHLAGAETVSGAKTFTQPIATATGSPLLIEGLKQAATSVTLDASYDFGFFLRSDNTLGCQLSAGLGGGSCMPAGSGGMTNPMTAANDMIVGGASGAPTRLATANSAILTTTAAGAQQWSTMIAESQIANLTADLTGKAAASGLITGNLPKAGGAASLSDSGVKAGPYTLPWMIAPRCADSAMSTITTAGKGYIWEANLVAPVTTTQVSYWVTTADNNSGAGHQYDLALYYGVPSAANNRILHVGASSTTGIPGTTFAPATGSRSAVWLEGSTTLQPGRYYLIYTSDCIAGGTSCAQIGADTTTPTMYYNNSFSVGGSGGASPASITSVADAFQPQPGYTVCAAVN